MKNGFLSLAAGILVSSTGFTQEARIPTPGCLDCFNFVAPSILGAENVNPAEVGLIVHDTYYNAFRGYTNAGIWSKLSNEINIRSVSASTTVLASDDVVAASAGSAYTIYLPTASSVTGKIFYIKKTDSSFNQITIDAYSTETIDSAATKKLSTQNEVLKLVSDGANWQILERRIPTEWQTYTPSTNSGWVTAGSPNYTGSWRRVGSDIEVDAKVSVSSTPSGTLAFGIPTGLTIDTNRLSDGVSTAGVGMGIAMDVPNGDHPIMAKVFTSTAIFAMIPNAAGTYLSGTNVNASIPFTFNAGDYVSLRFKVPIVGWEG